MAARPDWQTGTIQLAAGAATGSTQLRSIVSKSGTTGIALGNDAQSIVVTNRFGVTQTFVRADIVSGELLKDGVTILRTNRGSQIAGAIVGSALFGPLGAVVGGLSGSKTQTEKIASLTLRLVLNKTPYCVDLEFEDSNQARNALALAQSIIG